MKIDVQSNFIICVAKPSGNRLYGYAMFGHERNMGVAHEMGCNFLSNIRSAV